MLAAQIQCSSLRFLSLPSNRRAILDDMLLSRASTPPPSARCPILRPSPPRRLGLLLPVADPVKVWRRGWGSEAVRLRPLPRFKAASDECGCSAPESSQSVLSTVGRSTNIVWQDCAVGKVERQKLLNQKGCVIWITGLSGSGKSTLACALNQDLHSRGYLSYVLDGDNLRHGLNRDLSFKAEDRAENIRRVGEVAKLFADAGAICIASLISPYRIDRDACRALVPESTFIEVFMDMPLEICESRDPKGLYKLARAGKIKGFTGIDDPYEPPLNCEIVIRSEGGNCAPPSMMADQVISYLDHNGFLQA